MLPIAGNNPYEQTRDEKDQEDNAKDGSIKLITAGNSEHSQQRICIEPVPVDQIFDTRKVG